MEPTIAAMATAVLGITRNEARVVEALASQPELQQRGGVDEAIIDRLSLLTDAAIFLADVAPHERLVRELVRVGALVDFPAFSSRTADLRAGMIGLVRCKLLDVHPTECRIMLEAPGITQAVHVDLRAIVGVEKAPVRR